MKRDKTYLIQVSDETRRTLIVMYHYHTQPGVDMKIYVEEMPREIQHAIKHFKFADSLIDFNLIRFRPETVFSGFYSAECDGQDSILIKMSKYKSCVLLTNMNPSDVSDVTKVKPIEVPTNYSFKEDDKDV